MYVYYTEKGVAVDFERLDHIRMIHALSCWTVGGLTYFKLNRFEHKAIPTEDIITIKPEKEPRRVILARP